MRHSSALPPGRSGPRDIRGVFQHACEDPLQVTLGVAVQGHYGAELGLAGVQQRDAVQHRRLAGELVGQHCAGVVVLHQHVGEQADVLPPPPAEIVGVTHQVEGRAVVLVQRAVGQPLAEQVRGLLVARLGVHRSGCSPPSRWTAL